MGKQARDEKIETYRGSNHGFLGLRRSADGFPIVPCGQFGAGICGESPHPAERIAACWNALRGIADPEAFVAGAKKLAGDIQAAEYSMGDFDTQAAAVLAMTREGEIEKLNRRRCEIIRELEALDEERDRLRY